MQVLDKTCQLVEKKKYLVCRMEVGFKWIFLQISWTSIIPINWNFSPLILKTKLCLLFQFMYWQQMYRWWLWIEWTFKNTFIHHKNRFWFQSSYASLVHLRKRDYFLLKCSTLHLFLSMFCNLDLSKILCIGNYIGWWAFVVQSFGYNWRIYGYF